MRASVPHTAIRQLVAAPIGRGGRVRAGGGWLEQLRGEASLPAATDAGFYRRNSQMAAATP